MRELTIMFTSPVERDDFVAEIWDEDERAHIWSVERRAERFAFVYVGGDKLGGVRGRPGLDT